MHPSFVCLIFVWATTIMMKTWIGLHIYLFGDLACVHAAPHILGASYSMDYLRTSLLLHLVFRGLPSEYMHYGMVCLDICLAWGKYTDTYTHLILWPFILLLYLVLIMVLLTLFIVFHSYRFSVSTLLHVYLFTELCKLSRISFLLGRFSRKLGL
jgi:hypothetical protein